MSVSEEERRRVFQQAWETGGGFRFMFDTFGDIATDRDANKLPHFVRGKIAEIVKDPETARKLTRPTSTPSAPCATAATTRPSTGTT